MGFDLTTPSHVRLKSKVRNEDKAARTRGLNDDDVDRGTKLRSKFRCAPGMSPIRISAGTIQFLLCLRFFCTFVQSSRLTPQQPLVTVYIISRVILCSYMFIERHTGRLEILPFLKPAIETMWYCFKVYQCALSSYHSFLDTCNNWTIPLQILYNLLKNYWGMLKLYHEQYEIATLVRGSNPNIILKISRLLVFQVGIFKELCPSKLLMHILPPPLSVATYATHLTI